MKKQLLILSLFTINLLTAQIPSYIPTNGLVGYWQFNGNANDLSANVNNGTVNGATLTTDRFGNTNSAYSFNGINNFIKTNSIGIPTNTNISISVWLKPNVNFGIAEFISLGSSSNTTWGLISGENWNGSPYLSMNYGRGCNGNGSTNLAIAPTLNSWQHLVYVSTGVGGVCNLYINGNLIGQTTNATSGLCSNNNLYFGVDIFGPNYLNCTLDDIVIWNRALTQTEITGLYNATNASECQSLVINTGILSFNPVTYNNTVTIYPNPANDQITIDCGNLTNVTGYQIKIVNTLGQEVFSGAMNTQQYVVPLNTWGGTGVFFVKIYDAFNNLLNTKKIILQ